MDVPVLLSAAQMRAAMLLTGRSESWIEDGVVIGMIAACLALTYVAMRTADRLVTALGTGADVVRRVSGVRFTGWPSVRFRRPRSSALLR